MNNINPFEYHSYEILIPKQHLIEDLSLPDYDNNPKDVIPHNDNLLKISNHSKFIENYF